MVGHRSRCGRLAAPQQPRLKVAHKENEGGTERKVQHKACNGQEAMSVQRRAIPAAA